MNNKPEFITKLENEGFKVIIRNEIKTTKEHVVMQNLLNSNDKIVFLILDKKYIGALAKYLQHPHKIKKDSVVIETNRLSMFYYWPLLESTKNIKLLLGLRDNNDCIVCLEENPSMKSCGNCYTQICMDCFAHVTNCPICREQL